MSRSAKIKVQDQSKADTFSDPSSATKFSGKPSVVFFGRRGSFQSSYAGVRALRDCDYRRRSERKQSREYRKDLGPYPVPGSGSSWFLYRSGEPAIRRPHTRRLIRAVVWMDTLIDAYGLECAAGDFSRCKGDRSVCKKRAGRYLGEDWDGCPVRAIMDDRRLAASLLLERESAISPIAGWPDNYASWVSTYLTTLKQLRGDREVHAMKPKGKKWQRNA